MDIEDEEQEYKVIDLAKNMPGLVIVFGHSLFHQKMASSLDRLISHQSPLVRKTIAAGFHVLADKYFIPMDLKDKLADKFKVLINDDDHLVVGNILKNII